MAKGRKRGRRQNSPAATIPPLILLLFLSSSPFVFSGSPRSLSFKFTPAMGLVAGQPLHNSIQNTHTHTHCYSQARLCTCSFPSSQTCMPCLTADNLFCVPLFSQHALNKYRKEEKIMKYVQNKRQGGIVR